MGNTDPQHSTLGSVAVLIARTIRAYECDPDPLFRQSGIDIHRIFDPNARFPVVRMQRLWHLAVDKTGDPCFGLSAAAQFQPAALQGLGLAWLASDTLRDALNRLVRFSRLISTATEIQLADTGSGITLVVSPPAGWTEYVYASLDAAMAVFLRLCRLTGGNEIRPAGVTLVRPRPPCADRFDREFGAPVTYRAEANTFVFHQSDVDATLPHANPELARINDQTVVNYLARFDRTSITMQVRKRIIDELPDGTPHQESIADALHVSLRSLQRRLKEEDTNYKKLLESTRQELAKQYLRQSHRSIGEITYLLGFSEPGNFTRAFKRWTGKTPARYRKDA
ncbi:MAG: AraC family transcriptional regulator [Gammaproteobacteria bacterium]|jgi:AraC-like DNA-binding protein